MSAHFRTITSEEWKRSLQSARLRRAAAAAVDRSPQACAARAERLLERRLTLVRTHATGFQPETNSSMIKRAAYNPPMGADQLCDDAEL